MILNFIESSIATAIWIALGSSTGAVCFAAVLLAMVILALIPIYIPNHSQQGFGEGNLIYVNFIK